MAFGMNSFDKMSCMYAEQYYNALIELLDTILVFPKKMLKTMLDNIDVIKKTIYDAYMEQLELLLKRLDEYLDLKKPTRLIDCDQFLRCKVLIQGYVDDIRETLDPVVIAGMSVEEIFRRFVCGNGLNDMYENVKNDIRRWLDEALDDMLNNDAVQYIEDKIIELIREYEDFLNQPIKNYFPPFPAMFDLSFPFAKHGMGIDSDKMNIYDLIDFMNVFMGCVFDMCSLVASAKNKMRDVKSSLKIDSLQHRYVYDKNTTELINAKRKMEETLKWAKLQLAD